MKRAAIFFALLVLSLAPPAARALTAPEQQQFADGLYTRGIFDMAIAEYDRLLAAFPDYERTDLVLYRKAESFRKLNKNDEAFPVYQRIAGEFPKSPYRSRARLRIAEMLVQRNAFEQALPQLEGLIADKPEPAIASAGLYFQGMALKGLNRRDAARTAFQRLVGDHPDSGYAGYARLELGQLLEGNPAAQRESFRAVADNPPSARVGQEALYALMDLHYAANEHDATLAVFAEFSSRYSEVAPEPGMALKAAWAAHHARKPTDVRKALASVPNNHPEFEADRLYLLANAFRSESVMEPARQHYADLLRRFPENRYAPFASYETALIAFAANDHATVIAQASIMRRQPELAADASWLLAESYRASGKNEEAIVVFREILSLPGDNTRPAEARFHLARLLRELKREPEATKEFLEMARLHPAHELAPRALYTAAFLHLSQGDSSQAIAVWGRVASEYPSSELVADSLLQKGLMELKAGQEESARISLAQYIDVATDPIKAGEASYWLGMSLETGRDLEGAELRLRFARERLQASPLFAKVLYRLATVLQKREKMGEAADLLQAVLNEPIASEMGPPLLEWLAMYRLEQKQFQECVHAARTLQQRAEEPRWKQRGFHIAGLAYQHIGQKELAVEAFSAASDINADTRERAESSLLAGELWIELTQPLKALPLLDKAASGASQLGAIDLQARAYLALGEASSAASRWDDAGRYFMSVAVLFEDPTITPRALRGAAAAFDKLGRTTDRDRALSELAKRFPEAPPVATP